VSPAHTILDDDNDDDFEVQHLEKVLEEERFGQMSKKITKEREIVIVT
jgi:hypothetical protein